MNNEEEASEEETHSNFPTNSINSTEETFESRDMMVTTIVSDMNQNQVDNMNPISFHPTSKFQSSPGSGSPIILRSTGKTKKR
jgi:hypothetical protein